MTQKHTPGPWFAVNEGPHWNNPKIDMWNVYHGTDKEHVIDNVIECAYTEANARLIAAAPDLLEALQDAIKYIKIEGGLNKNLVAASLQQTVNKATGAA